MTKEYATVVFMQGDEAYEVTDKLLNVEGVVMHGATEESVSEAIAYLSQWGMGEDMTWSESAPWGQQDHVWEAEGYILTASRGGGFVSLNRSRTAAE